MEGDIFMCAEYETNLITTTDGQKEKKIACSCGTTACLKVTGFVTFSRVVKSLGTVNFTRKQVGILGGTPLPGYG